MSSADSRLKGKVALVTGSSSGAGAEIAREFGRLGAHVAVHCRSNFEAAQQVVGEIRREGHSATAFRADLSVPVETRRLTPQPTPPHLQAPPLRNNTGPST